MSKSIETKRVQQMPKKLRSLLAAADSEAKAKEQSRAEEKPFCILPSGPCRHYLSRRKGLSFANDTILCSCGAGKGGLSEVYVTEARVCRAQKQAEEDENTPPGP